MGFKWTGVRLWAVVAACGAVAVVAAPSVAGAAPTWNKVSSIGGVGTGPAGLYRTADGNLHVLWPTHVGSAQGLHYSTLSPIGALLNTGKVVSNWGTTDQFPELVKLSGGGIRAVFNGTKSGTPYSDGAVFSTTSSEAGTSWTLVNGSLSHSTFVPLTDGSAGATSTGTPVAAWVNGTNVEYHVGVDPHIPATAPDGTIATPTSNDQGTAVARNSDGSVWLAWYGGPGSNPSYHVDQVLPSLGPKPLQAPGSSGTYNNAPNQHTAFVARAGGGLFMAYCTATTSSSCAHIDLWKVGASTAMVVPESTTGTIRAVCIASTPKGKLRISWFNGEDDMIHTVATNTKVTGFGTVQSIGMPPKAGNNALATLVAEASKGPLDLVAEVNMNVAGFPLAYWHIQLP